MSISHLSTQQARLLALDAQGLLFPPAFSNAEEGILKTLKQLSYIQIDTISVIQRSHHHTFWTRLADYQSNTLMELQQTGQILEYWSHAASYLPMEDYRFCLPRMQAFATGKKHWFPKNKKVNSYVLDRIRAEGALMSKDFKGEQKKKAGWWNWSATKKALEQLFMEGRLMVKERRGFQKVYDLPERILPTNLNTTPPTTEAYIQHLINRFIQAYGVVSASTIGHLKDKATKTNIQRALKQLVETEQIIAVRIEKKDTLFYTSPTILQTLPSITTQSKKANTLHLLSPFDNAVIHRKRLTQLFDFNYKIECYVPKAKRVYGYFSLPILWNQQFIGRLDPKADRKTGIFYLQHLVFEPHFQDFEAVLPLLAQKIKALAQFNGCSQIQVKQVKPSFLKVKLQAVLS